jgi:hypothetical protein
MGIQHRLDGDVWKGVRGDSHKMYEKGRASLTDANRDSC